MGISTPSPREQIVQTQSILTEALTQGTEDGRLSLAGEVSGELVAKPAVFFFAGSLLFNLRHV